jgi:hypothetical protein
MTFWIRVEVSFCQRGRAFQGKLMAGMKIEYPVSANLKNNKNKGGKP